MKKFLAGALAVSLCFGQWTQAFSWKKYVKTAATSAAIVFAYCNASLAAKSLYDDPSAVSENLLANVELHAHASALAGLAIALHTEKGAKAAGYVCGAMALSGGLAGYVTSKTNLRCHRSRVMNNMYEGERKVFESILYALVGAKVVELLKPRLGL